MKKYLFLSLFLIPLWVNSQLVTILPDSVWEDPKAKEWWPYGTAFYNYNGKVYCAIMDDVIEVYYYAVLQQSLYPYFFVFKQDNKNQPMSEHKFGIPPQNFIDYFNYPKENSTGGMVPEIHGRNFFFEFNQRLWYYQHVLTGLTVNNGKDRKNESYECFAQMKLDKDGKLSKVYYDLNNPVPEVVKYSAFQLDSLLFFIGMNNNPASPHYAHWCLQQYSYDPGLGKFIKGPDIYPDIYYPAGQFGGYSLRLDADQNVSILLDTYSISTFLNVISLLTPVKTATGYDFNVQTLDVSHPPYPAGSLVMAKGSIKGQRTSEPNPTLSDRFVYLMTTTAKFSDGKYHIYYKEFGITPDNQLSVVGQGEVKLGNYPKPLTYYVNGQQCTSFDMAVAYELLPKDYTTQLAGYDGYQKRLNFFYPDRGLDLNSAQFVSDQFKLNGAETVVSTDLDDKVSYEGIDGLWSLAGIVDGAPPSSMNWHVWDSTLNLNQHEESPTKLEFVSSTEQKVVATNTFEDRWSVGANLEFEKEGKSDKAFTLSGDLKYFGAYEAEIQNKTTVSKETILSFVLNEHNQEKGWFIWTVPEMTRYRYDTYPWWDGAYHYPVANSTNYLFRTTGLSTILQKVDLAEHPFYIHHPNDPDMSYWKYQAGNPSRDSIMSNSVTYSRPRIDNISWTDGQSGTGMDYTLTNEYSSKYTHTNGFKEKVGIGLKIPKVFQFSVYESNEFSFSTAVECETAFGTEIKATLEPMVSSSLGIQIEYLNMDVYWMHEDSVQNPVTNKWEPIEWWYYEGLNGMKPWYLAYIVNTAYSKIHLLSPQNLDIKVGSEILFTWETEGEPLSDFVVHVYNSAGFTSSSLIYRNKTGDSKLLNPVTFIPEPGKTYYWVVSGRTSTGEVVWSPKSSFSVKDDAPLAENSTLKAIIYPNPGNPDHIRIAVSSEQTGTALCSIYSTGGMLLFSEEVFLSGTSETITIKSPANLGQGVYVVVIQGNGQRVTRKMVVI